MELSVPAASLLLKIGSPAVIVEPVLIRKNTEEPAVPILLKFVVDMKSSVPSKIKVGRELTDPEVVVLYLGLVVLEPARLALIEV